MSAPSILPPDDDPVSFPSMPTLHGGDPDALGRIDHYDLLRKLGGGGFGVVYLAKDSNSGVEVALKTLHPLLKTNAEEMDALREKFALVSRLTHTNIAKALVLHPVRDVNIWDETARKEMRLSPGDSVMVMDYAPGVTLSRWRRQFPDGIVPLDLALEIARQVASALDYAHGERIVHRDIKPGNIMVETLRAAEGLTVERSDGRTVAASDPQTLGPSDRQTRIRARILDFGLAAEIRSSMSRVSTEQGDTSGTRPYMAPEQWLGKKQDGRTDQYALACVLYEMLSGAPPFAGVFETGDPMIMKDAVVRDAPEELEGVSPAVNAALLRALAKTPKERFPSCAEFVGSCLAQSSQSAQRHEDFNLGGAPQGKDGSPGELAQPDATQESDVLRRKLALSRDLMAIPENVRSDAEFSKFLSTAEDEIAVADEAIRLDKFAAAAESLGRVEAALDELRKAREEYGKVQLWAGGPYWAKTNVGADKPEDCGLYFWWGDTVGYCRRKGLVWNRWGASNGSSRNFSFVPTNAPTYDKSLSALQREGWTTSAGVLVPAHDAAHVQWGGSWRMPTEQELRDLTSNCDWTWMTTNGVNGYVVQGRGDYASASIFLPAAGYGDGSSLCFAGSSGYYWSAVPNSGSNYVACSLYFGSGGHGVSSGYYRGGGQSIRPVQGFDA